MYFIIDGKVNILSPNENQIVATLYKGSYFGEIALFSESRRICSVLAGSFCQIYILDKKNLEKILVNFPFLEEKFKKEGEKRLKEYNDKKINAENERQTALKSKSNLQDQTDSNESSESSLDKSPKNEEESDLSALDTDKQTLIDRKPEIQIKILSDEKLKVQNIELENNSPANIVQSEDQENNKWGGKGVDKKRATLQVPTIGSHSKLGEERKSPSASMRMNEAHSSFLNKALDGSRLGAPSQVIGDIVFQKKSKRDFSASDNIRENTMQHIVPEEDENGNKVIKNFTFIYNCKNFSFFFLNDI